MNNYAQLFLSSALLKSCDKSLDKKRTKCQWPTEHQAARCQWTVTEAWLIILPFFFLIITYWNYKIRPLIKFKCMTGPPTGLQSIAEVGSNVCKIYCSIQQGMCNSPGCLCTLAMLWGMKLMYLQLRYKFMYRSWELWLTCTGSTEVPWSWVFLILWRFSSILLHFLCVRSLPGS